MDLFSAISKLEALRIPGAEISYASRIDLPKNVDSLLSELISEIPWRQESINVWGKSHAQPRLVSWFGDDGATYTYSGLRLNPHPWIPLLLDIRESVEKLASASFNSVLLNLYRDHRDSMGFHSDDEPELGTRPIIASVSLGAERTFILKPKANPDWKTVRIKLQSGSLLLMAGDTQKNWKHGIDKEVHPCGPRVNLTFRQIS